MSRRVLRRIAATACMVLIAGAAQAQTLTVEVERSSPLSEGDLRNAVGSAPLTIVSRGAKTTIITDTAGYKHLLADETIQTVRLVSGTVATRAGEIDAEVFKVRLLTAAPGPAAAVEATAARNASHTAQLVSRRALKETLQPQSGLGPGKLLVIGRDTAEHELTRSVIDDPRLVRYEARGADGRITGRRDFYRRNVELSVVMPAEAGIASLSIVGTDLDGQKELARVPVR